MSEVASIGLNQLVLWYDGTRIQAWPSFLAAVPAGVLLSSATDFGRQFDTERMTDTRHAAAEKIVRNLPGLEKKGRRHILKGIGLLELTPEGYRLSREGRELALSYSRDPKGKAWTTYLGALLLTREPRTRVVVRALSQDGAELHFDGPRWFSGNLKKARIETGGSAVYPFQGNEDVPSLRVLLREHSWWALGFWRQDPLLEYADNCHFTGTLQEEFSLHDVGLALRGVFEILLHLGVLRSAGGVCWLDRASAAGVFGEHLTADYGWAGRQLRVSAEELIARHVKELRSDTGFVIASDLRSALQQDGIDNPDAEIARLQSLGTLVIEAEDYGQARHGQGLFGDPRKQMVQIRVLTRS